ncbi:peptide ABC transporter permease [Neokomagataea thailandica NBRC 106555]|uniref:ABC transporter permease n=2 Tax=Neokomagataea TaxID=1223423 RepID=A0A4Y6VBW2_9PROT|nr:MULTISPECIES: ABC transporter permease [Neokomagataea]QDH25875.1 ABC transporter permease [Neokomagataea tanensis]GBR49970.1 peptide ABC transporter permease [Neokomagataea thailandica NBRC 106555]
MSVLFILVVATVVAPVYARWCGIDAFASNVAGTTLRAGRLVDLMQPNDNPLHLGLSPLGPDWTPGAYMLGADTQGRDVAARLLYGGRNSLIIASAAATLCLALACSVALWSGYSGGWVDAVLSRCMDIMWAIPVYLLAISLSVVTLGRGLHLGSWQIRADSLLIPIVIIGLVYVPYAARTLRARVKQFARAEFVLAARGAGASDVRIIFVEILPNLLPALLVMAPLVMALCLMAESALSFLSLGVQAPAASWGTIILDGEGLLYTRPLVAIAPGILIATTVLSLNVLGGSLQKALDRTGPSVRGRK